MAFLLGKLLSPILGPRQRKKIAIIGLDDAVVTDLLKRLCGTAKEKLDVKTYARAHTGTKRTLSCDIDYVALEVGGSNGNPEYRVWMAAQYEDADGFIWVLNGGVTECIWEAREEIKTVRMGRPLRQLSGQGGEKTAGVSPDAPWLVLVDFKGDPLSIDEATRQVEIVIADSGDTFDWTFRAVSTATSEGLREATGWLNKK
ncbi:hypothetical protein V496_04158 [Pseudogymnoascus sp. VKM F-4515 (FW-2607)]|nr:hypothetical protein V496_04158 [Pseudogymnoascus sp. VKM F-4515 (FW-2607)]